MATNEELYNNFDFANNSGENEGGGKLITIYIKIIIFI